MNLLFEHSHYFIPFGICYLFIAYNDFAKNTGLSIGAFFLKYAEYLNMFGFFMCGWALIESFIKIKWFSPIIVLVIGFFIGFTIIRVFKSWTQLLAILLGIVSFFIIGIPHARFLKIVTNYF